MIRFDAPWDRQLRIGTTILVALLLGVGAGVLVLGLSLSGTSPDLLYPFFIAPIVLIAVLGGAWLLAPRGFAVDGAALLVERRIGPVRVPLGAIREVGPLPGGLGGSLRLGGNGGLFGYHGRFWSRHLGAFRLYATRRIDLVRIETDDDVLVLSPAEPERFVDLLLAHAPRARRQTAPGEGAPRPLHRRRIFRTLALVAFAAVMVLGGIFAASQAFAPTSARVTADAVRVERRWTGPIDFPLRGIRSAEVLASQYGRRWWRTNGTSLGAVRYGRFASRELGPFRLYAWRYGPYVLLETVEGRLVLTPDDPERFVREVRARLGE